MKSPLEMVVSAARALDAHPTDAFILAQKIADMGEPLYGKEAPNGYKDSREAWLSTAGVMARVEFANALANGLIPGVRVDNSRFAGKMRLRFPASCSSRSLRANTGGNRKGSAGRSRPRDLSRAW